jgi:hypothetical protein
VNADEWPAEGAAPPAPAAGARGKPAAPAAGEPRAAKRPARAAGGADIRRFLAPTPREERGPPEA